MDNEKDTLIGKKFHALTVIEFVGPVIIHKQRRRGFLALCDCGVTRIVCATYLKRGFTKSCGCSVLSNKWEIVGCDAVLNKNGSTCIIDAEDVGKVKFLNFGMDSDGYWKAKLKNKRLKMHRIIVGVTSPNPKVHTDHKDGDRSNNRKSNLRSCTSGQNKCNSKIRSDSKTGYKGVICDRGRWRAKIGINGKRIDLGYFDSAVDAANAYDAAAVKYHGEFARTNRQIFGATLYGLSPDHESSASI